MQEPNGKFVDVYNGGNITTGGISVRHNGRHNRIPLHQRRVSDTYRDDCLTADMTVTTNRGLLKTSNTYIYSFETGFFTVMALIDPNLSTGRFAGATGVVHLTANDRNRRYLYLSVWRHHWQNLLHASGPRRGSQDIVWGRSDRVVVFAMELLTLDVADRTRQLLCVWKPTHVAVPVSGVVHAGR